MTGGQSALCEDGVAVFDLQFRCDDVALGLEEEIVVAPFPDTGLEIAVSFGQDHIGFANMAPEDGRGVGPADADIIGSRFNHRT